MPPLTVQLIRPLKFKIDVVPPLAILLAYTLFAQDVSETGRRLLPALGLTYLGGFMAMLWLHQGLLAPVVMSSEAMRKYLTDEQLALGRDTPGPSSFAGQSSCGASGSGLPMPRKTPLRNS